MGIDHGTAKPGNGCLPQNGLGELLTYPEGEKAKPLEGWAAAAHFWLVVCFVVILLLCVVCVVWRYL